MGCLSAPRLVQQSENLKVRTMDCLSVLSLVEQRDELKAE